MEQEAVPPIGAPCGASDIGVDKFVVVHKVFGASNVKKLLSNIPANYQNVAVETISYEAGARLSDPIYGCAPTIKALQQKVATLQAELTMLQSQLVNTEFSAYATAIVQQQPNFNVEVQPTYSNNSYAFNTNFMNMSDFNSGFDLPTEPPQYSRFS